MNVGDMLVVLSHLPNDMQLVVVDETVAVMEGMMDDSKRVPVDRDALIREGWDRDGISYIPTWAIESFVISAFGSGLAAGRAEGLVPREQLFGWLTTLRHARTFITSREKMHSDGVMLYDEDIAALERAYAAPSREKPAEPSCIRRTGCDAPTLCRSQQRCCAADERAETKAEEPAEPVALSDRLLVNDLAMMVRRLAYRLNKADPGNSLSDAAKDYLVRAGLQGSPLRNDYDASPAGREEPK